MGWEGFTFLFFALYSARIKTIPGTRIQNLRVATSILYEIQLLFDSLFCSTSSFAACVLHQATGFCVL